MSKFNPFQQITNTILADLQNGVAPWVKPWETKAEAIGAATVFPVNFSTKKEYRGINIILGLVACYAHGWSVPAFATFKQITAMGGSVKKGSKATQIYFMAPVEFDPKADTPEQQLNENGKIERFILRGYNVFNIEQTEGLSIDFASLKVPSNMPEDTAELVKALAVNLYHGGNEACYISALDRVNMPLPEVFESVDHYKATLFHEVTHWTGHKSRLDRLEKSKGKAGYAYEELVAELGAAFLAMEFGITAKLRHADYIGEWIKALEDDERAFYKAAQDAQKALDFIRQAVTNSTSAEEEDQREAA